MAFNQDKICMIEFQRLYEYIGSSIAIETGTYKGETTETLSKYFDKVYSIEINKEFAEKAKERFINNSKIEIINGNSSDVLKEIIPKIINSDKYIFFYLDAHWNDYWPILDELKLIDKYLYGKAIIWIDDFKVPYRNFGYDRYSNVELSNDFIKSSLANDYIYIYNHKVEHYPNPYSAGKLFLYPTNLQYIVSNFYFKDNGYLYSNI